MDNEGKSISQMPVTELIKIRRSCRSYTSQKLSEDLKGKIAGYFSELKESFDIKTRFVLVDNFNSEDSGVKLGTYGIIKGAPSFIAAAVEKGNMNMKALGYAFEKLILFATSMGLGTCWLGGTFKKGEFSKAIGLKDNEILPIVSPIGYSSESRRLLDSFLRLSAGSNNRLDWDKLFFKNNFSNKLSREDAGNYSTPLEMVRLAPSASNKQPWRIVSENNAYHFYLQHTKGYGKILGYDIQKVDMGIAMCHFELAARELGLDGSWSMNAKITDNVPREMEYITSWI